MLQITPQMRILVAVEAVDFRKGIDSLAELCRAKLNADPFSGCVFVFRSRRATSIKVLVYDGQGFWLATKRLSKGRFRWWPQIAEGAKEPTPGGLEQARFIIEMQGAHADAGDLGHLFDCVTYRFFPEGHAGLYRYLHSEGSRNVRVKGKESWKEGGLCRPT
jgi:transposase